MPDLLSRDLAIGAIEEEQRKQRLAAIDLEAESPTLAQACLVKALGMEYAIAALRAQPSHGTCTTCAEWYEYAGEGRGRCCWAHECVLLTPPDHFCAACHPQEAQP
jgi:hypothetical protein